MQQGLAKHITAEMFVDASDYGWSATLCQRVEHYGTPQIIAIIAKPFTDVQLRWSGMAGADVH